MCVRESVLGPWTRHGSPVKGAVSTPEGEMNRGHWLSSRLGWLLAPKTPEVEHEKGQVPSF